MGFSSIADADFTVFKVILERIHDNILKGCQMEVWSEQGGVIKRFKISWTAYF
ncbi:MAG: hypothetical protein LBP89_01635 [Helicobacteraceae bacterium]|nr:hypothetical protein [Helicobacteraceae bacterium]